MKAERMEDFVLDSSSTARDPCLRAKLEGVHTRFQSSAVTTPREHPHLEARRKASAQRLSMLKRVPKEHFFFRVVIEKITV
jgi:hypothetical protein